MSVIGFDIGNESCVIAVAKRGGVDVLLNNESKRETPAVVSFGGKQRFLGSAGAAYATANPKSTVSQIKRLIGKLYKEVEEDLKQLPFTTREGPRGGILIELDYMGTEWTFTPVEILAMLLKHLKQLTEKNLETSVVDCVIGIPSYFSDLQRRLYLDAALLAGLKPLRLMHDGTAIALGYGMYKTDFSDSGPTIVMFVDIGHCDTQVTLAAFEQGRMKILSHTFDQNLGGRDFDEVLFNHFAAQFNEEYKLNVYSNVRASARLRASCEKVKKVLSANAEAPLSIECLIGDNDVRGFITREEFENLSSKLLERVTVPCDIALKNCRLSVDKIHIIELVGSGSRIPAITKILTSFFKKEPTRTLNASECVARGCALRCAMLSPSLIVRDYKVEDSFPYSILIPTPQGEIMLFSKGSPFPSLNTMNHHKRIPFYVQVAYRKEMDFPAGTSHIVGRFGIGQSELSDAEKVKVKFVVKLNDSGIVELDSATIIEDTQYFGGLWNVMAGSHMSNDLNLSFTENVDVSTTNDELNEAIKKEKMLTEQDIKVETTKDQRNTLESFVYDTRSKLSSSYKRFASDSETEVITKNLQETEEWLYEDSDDESEQDYTGKLNHLKKLLEPVETRYNEDIAIAKATKSLQSCIATYHSHANSLPADKKEKVNNVCTEAEKWLSSLTQKDLPPKTLADKINHATDVVESKCKNIIRSEASSSSDSADARAKAAKPLHTCITNYYLLAESLRAEKKEKVKNVCRDAEHRLIDFIYTNSPSKTWSNKINLTIEMVVRKCKNIIRSEASFSRHKEPVGSVTRDQPLDSENARAQAAKPLYTCIVNSYLLAESLPPVKKEKVENVCREAVQWLINFLYQKDSSSKTLPIDINHAVNLVESECHRIISSESSFSMPEHSDLRDQTVESDQKDQLRDSESDWTKAANSLQNCIEEYRSQTESLSEDVKLKVARVGSVKGKGVGVGDEGVDVVFEGGSRGVGLARHVLGRAKDKKGNQNYEVCCSLVVCSRDEGKEVETGFDDVAMSSFGIAVVLGSVWWRCEVGNATRSKKLNLINVETPWSVDARVGDAKEMTWMSACGRKKEVMWSEECKGRDQPCLGEESGGLNDP
ncbi:hypothetical protein E3N88_05222 [Mikania micrantha]|uniref:Uncharacterized protein n=1 Tax=Mikania micrantha TaxID=192012 RepID=A0A5N6PWP5_9ASTR|nr:hypothetical protein E3N88_05222 [Mikania micrantha]